MNFGLKKSVFAAFAFLAALTFASAAPRAADQTKVFQFALANGLQVLVIPDTRAPVITQMLWFKVGGMDDPRGLSGLAHFFEHMMFRGTKKYPGDTFSNTVARNGGDDNAFTSHDYTAFYERIAKDRMPIVMALEADRMAHLNLSDAGVVTERDIVLEERRMRVDNDPQALTMEQLAAALHLSHPYGRPVIGWAEEIRHIGRQEAQNFYNRHYSPNNAILIVAGDVTADEVRKTAEATYGKVPARPKQPRADYAQPPRLGETRLSITRADAQVPMFVRSYRVLSYAQAKPGQAEALETLAMLMGGDELSALYRKLVVEKRLATDAGASYDGFARDAGTFTVYAMPRPGVSLEQVERATDEVIQSLAQKQAAPKDLARSKTQLVASATYRRDSQMAMAQAYGQALAIGLTVEDVRAWPDRINRVTADAVRKAAASALNKREAATAYLRPAPQARQQKKPAPKPGKK
jgi:zinc protease